MELLIQLLITVVIIYVLLSMAAYLNNFGSACEMRMDLLSDDSISEEVEQDFATEDPYNMRWRWLLPWNWELEKMFPKTVAMYEKYGSCREKVDE